MAQQSQLSRYHPAVLSVAGIGAAYAIYAAYTAYSHRPTASSLHRSNAIHRPRRERPNRLESSGPSADAPLGTVSIIRNGHDFVINLATTQVPSTEQLRTLFGPGAEDMRRQLQSQVLHTILIALVTATPDSETWTIAGSFGFGDLLLALETMPHDPQEIARAAEDVRRVMNLDSLRTEDIEHEVNFLLETALSPADNRSRSSSDVDLAETEDLDPSANREPSQGLRGLLYYIAEDNAKRNAYEHRGITCEECNLYPITGIRWHCLNCPDYDLCSSCETHTRHPKTHVFAKIKIPLPILSQPTKEYRIWYPGDPRRIHSSLDPVTRKRLGNEHNFEEPQMDALYDQFLTIANVPWDSDPSKVHAAIDRRAFDKALSSDRWPGGLVTNAMFDRMFAFYDTDNNGIIGFEEFLSGMAYLRGPRRYATLKRALQGYDLDGDGYVIRKDFLTLLRAKFIIQQQLVHDSIEGQQMEQTQSGLEVLRSSQPISSMFTQEEIPLGETRRPRGKQPDSHGDLQPLPTTKALLDETDPYTTSIVPAAHERLRTHLSRFEDMIYGSDEPRDSSHDTGTPHGATMVLDLRHEGPRSALDQALDVPKLFSDHEYEIEEPYVEDALWHVIQQGFNDLLDGLFKDKEREDLMIMSTSDERTRWREQIDTHKAAEQQFREQLVATAATDPLMATAMSSYNVASGDRNPPELPQRSRQEAFNDQPVPTNWDDLTRREERISDAPLDELLNATGYGLRDDADAPESRQVASQSTDLDTWDSSTLGENTSSSKSEDSSEDRFDPTLPHHRPDTAEDAVIPDVPSDKAGPADESDTHLTQPPSKQRLQLLARLDDLERELDERGGPGRLSYDEIERITVADSRGELRGLVKSWLEWAAF